MTLTAIVSCNCPHANQDKRYGKNNRVANFARNANNKVGGYRCTVCQRLHSTGAAKETPTQA